MKTIFLVDDSATILLSISSILGKAGYTVEKAANAEDALKKFKAGVKINLLITDLNMPGMNGIELIREVRKLPAYKFVPILFLTTESQQSKKVEAKAAVVATKAKRVVKKAVVRTKAVAKKTKARA